MGRVGLQVPDLHRTRASRDLRTGCHGRGRTGGLQPCLEGGPFRCRPVAASSAEPLSPPAVVDLLWGVGGSRRGNDFLDRCGLARAWRRSQDHAPFVLRGDVLVDEAQPGQDLCGDAVGVGDQGGRVQVDCGSVGGRVGHGVGDGVDGDHPPGRVVESVQVLVEVRLDLLDAGRVAGPSELQSDLAPEVSVGFGRRSAAGYLVVPPVDIGAVRGVGADPVGFLEPAEETLGAHTYIHARDRSASVVKYAIK